MSTHTNGAIVDLELAWDAERDAERRRALAELAATAAVLAQEWTS